MIIYWKDATIRGGLIVFNIPKIETISLSCGLQKKQKGGQITLQIKYGPKFVEEAEGG